MQLQEKLCIAHQVTRQHLLSSTVWQKIDMMLKVSSKVLNVET
jgi:hypothetical protein